jgi:hypothetical protein
VTQSESGTKVNSVPQRALGEVNIRRLVLRQFNPFAAAIVLGKNFAVKHRCDSEDLTLHAVLSDGDNTVRQTLEWGEQTAQACANAC